MKTNSMQDSLFTDSLELALKLGKPYSKFSSLEENNEVPVETKALIVFIPGWSIGLHKYFELVQDIFKRLDDESFPPWDFLPFRYNNHFLSLKNPDDIARELVETIERHLCAVGKDAYKQIFLFGHSVGGLLARKAVLLGYNDDKASPKSWLGRVHFVLLASTNRGYLTETLPVYLIVLDKITDLLYLVKFPRFLIKYSIRGSDWVNTLRLSWLHTFTDPIEAGEHLSEKPLAPPTIQLIGERDRVVKRDDSLDIYRFKNTVERVIRGVTHSGFLDKPCSRDLVITEIVSAFHMHLENKYPAGENPTQATLSHLKQPSCLVFLIHGIRDFADWQETLEDTILKKDPHARIISVRYGYFTTLQFLLPSQRRRTVRVFTDRYIQEFSKYPSLPIHVAAHSYGTYIFGRAMERQPGIAVKRVYLAGSVLPQKFDWRRFQERLEGVRNDCANGDWAVGVLCRTLQWLPWNRDIGTAGFDGFLPESESFVKSNRFIEGGHGAALELPVTEEIADFLLTPQLGHEQWKLQTPVAQEDQLISWAFLFIILIG